MNSLTVQYIHCDHLISHLQFLHNEQKKCDFCVKDSCDYCQPIKNLETEMLRKSFFRVQSDIT